MLSYLQKEKIKIVSDFLNKDLDLYKFFQTVRRGDIMT